MKLRFGIKLISLLFAVTFISSMVGYIVGARNSTKNTSPENAASSSLPPLVNAEDISISQEYIPPEEEKPDITKSYVIREKDGKLSLYSKFSDGREKLYQSYDISVTYLPKSDRELLLQGIETESLSDALQLVEDYSS